MHNSDPTPQRVKRMELIEVKSLIWAQKGKLYLIYENVM
jgi:hypothetical protein